jgi:hypothetical protein
MLSHECSLLCYLQPSRVGTCFFVPTRNNIMVGKTTCPPYGEPPWGNADAASLPARIIILAMLFCAHLEDLNPTKKPLI